MENEKKKPFVFEMTDVESERARAFMKKHYQCPSRAEERFAVTFLPTGMGDMVFIRCLACGEQEELTETEKF
jgi:uncharacterized protein CbrC (UPF0167 family)